MPAREFTAVFCASVFSPAVCPFAVVLPVPAGRGIGYLCHDLDCIIDHDKLLSPAVREAGGKNRLNFAAGAKWLRALSTLIRHCATRVVTSLVPDPMLARGTYHRDAVPPQSWEDEYGSGKWSYMNGLQIVWKVLARF
jgi:hypothetical protein